MIADLHAHYPMHLTAERPDSVWKVMKTKHAKGQALDGIRTRAIGMASRFMNYQSFDSGPRVTVPQMRAGNVGLALSVLHSPLDEMDLTKLYGAPPDEFYFPRILRQLELVEEDLTTNFPRDAIIARNPKELDEAVAADKLAIVHVLEGGYQLGGSVETIQASVAELARRGIAYITVAHLFWRSIAANNPAIPFIPDPIYKMLWPAPEVGLSELGRALITAMVSEGILIDLTHMNTRAMDETFTLLDELDPEKKVPVLATHVGFRFGHDEYMLTAETIERIAERGGAMGVIYCDKYISAGLRRRRTTSFAQSFQLLCHHIDRIKEITGSHAFTALGSDLDGYIKPTLAGLESMSDNRVLEEALIARYGDEKAAQICSGTALDVLHRGWRGAS